MAAGGGLAEGDKGRRLLRRVARSLDGGGLSFLDGYPFWLPRLRRYLVSRHNARIEITLDSQDAAAAQASLERRGWRHLSTSGPADGHEGDVILTMTAASRAGFGSAVSFGRVLTVALTDAGIRTLRHVVIDDALPPYRALDEWRPRAASATERPLRVFANAGAGCPPPALQSSVDQTSLDRVDPLTGRLLGAARAAESALERDAVGTIVVAFAAILGLVAFVITQLAASNDRSVRGPGAYYWRGDGIRIALLLCGGGCAALTIAWRFAGKYRRPLSGGAFALGCLTAGILLGGIPRGLFSLDTVAGLAAFSGIWALWELAAVPRLRSITTALRIGTVIAGVVAFGRWRIIVYFAGMGLSTSDVDISPTDAVIVGLRPVALAAFTAAVLLAIAWFASGHAIRVIGVALTIVAVSAAAGQLVGTLGADEDRGRRVAAGIAGLSPPGVRLDPAPIAMCVTAISSALQPPPPGLLLGALPVFVWKVGVLGQQVLVLSPEAARVAYPDLPAGSDPRLHVPSRNVAAPIWYLPGNQVALRRAASAAC